jgi:chorismate mutase
MHENKSISISELRIKLDNINEKLIAGLKTRSKYPLNMETFIEDFSENKSWVLYRLKKEQDIDSEYGRFLYNDQSPFIFTKSELSKSKIRAAASDSGVEQIHIDMSKKIFDLYKEMLYEICAPGEDRATYGETVKIDVENILTLNERTVGIGEQVAGYKMHSSPEILNITDPEKLRSLLVVPEREKEVIEKTARIAEKDGLVNIEQIKDFTQKIIDLTTEVEIKRILLTKR